MKTSWCFCLQVTKKPVRAIMTIETADSLIVEIMNSSITVVDQMPSIPGSRETSLRSGQMSLY